MTTRSAAVSAPPETRIFSSGELAALREESHDVNEQGEVEPRAAKIPLRRRIRWAFRSYPRIHRATFSLDLGGNGWAALQDAIRVRDRLTHPKAEAGLTVSDDDMAMIGTASRWYQDQVMALPTECQAADTRITSSLSNRGHR